MVPILWFGGVGCPFKRGRGTCPFGLKCRFEGCAKVVEGKVVVLDFARGAGPGEVLTLTMNAVTNQLVISATQRSATSNYSLYLPELPTMTNCSVYLLFLDVCSDLRDGKTPI